MAAGKLGDSHQPRAGQERWGKLLQAFGSGRCNLLHCLTNSLPLHFTALYLFFFFFFCTFESRSLLFLRQLKHRNEAQGNTHCIPGMIRLCSLHSTPGAEVGGSRVPTPPRCIPTGKKPWAKQDDPSQALPMNTRAGKKSPRAFFQVLLQQRGHKTPSTHQDKPTLEKKKPINIAESPHPDSCRLAFLSLGCCLSLPLDS